MTRLAGQAPVQPVTMAAVPDKMNSKPPAESARAPLGTAKLTASHRARTAGTIRLAAIRCSMLPTRTPERQAHTCTILWREEL